MFTGIIEETGKIRQILMAGNSGQIRIEALKVLEGTKEGDSIAVNGVCLTVTSLSRGEFTADIMAETYRRSGLGQQKAGDLVNLERAMAADGRFGGHIVAGHVDGTGIITNIKKDDNAVWYTISADSSIMKYIIEKGSVAVDGISLTVAEVLKDSFSVSVIPHTAKETILSQKKPGDTVNLENDLVGKYVEKLLNFNHDEKPKSRITREFLANAGF